MWNGIVCFVCWSEIQGFCVTIGNNLRRVWKYQRGNQNPYIEEQTTQWPKEKGQKYKQRSTKHTYITKDHVTQAPLKTGISSFCSIWPIGNMKKKYFTDSRNMIEPKLCMNNQIDEHVQVSLYWNRKAVWWFFFLHFLSRKTTVGFMSFFSSYLGRNVAAQTWM